MSDSAPRRPVRRRRGAALTSLVLATTVLLAGCGFSVSTNNQSATCESPPSDADSELSTIDAEGVACILEAHRARFDMSEGTIDKTVLQVPSDEYAPDVQSRDGLIDLEIVAPQGTVVASTDHIRFFTTDAAPDIKRITYFVQANTSDELFEFLRDGTRSYGLDRDSVEAWIESVSSQSDAVSDFAFNPGTLLGLNVSYDVRYDETAAVQVVIVEVYPL